MFKNYIVAVCVIAAICVLHKQGCFDGLLEMISFIRYGEDVASDTDAALENDDAHLMEGSGDDSLAGHDAAQDGEDVRYITYERKSNLKDRDYYYKYKNEKLAWWFKRNNEHGPSGCDNTLEIGDYGGYYLDTASGTEEKVLYLTFDCGYENGYTERILDVLKKHNVPACFFVTKTYIRDNNELVKRMKSEGHQVGNHTITHPSMPKKSCDEIVAELTGCADYMKEVTGYDMDPYIRPPMGEYSERTLAISADLGYKTIFWSMAYLDYDVNKQPGADYVIEHFNKYHHSGAIILMHNVSSSNAAALETVIENMKGEGYRFASLNELK